MGAEGKRVLVQGPVARTMDVAGRVCCSLLPSEEEEESV
jgi:hypothetical protein